MEQLHFITKLLDIKDPNIKILDIINMDTHKEIIAKLDYEAPSCPDCGSLMKKYDFQKPSHFECNFRNLPEIMSWDVETVRGVTVSIGRWR
ncbi:degenerate transposase [Streptococcus pneumoniae]|nr:degenerate transposase [Streptococcus pneumoniae]